MDRRRRRAHKNGRKTGRSERENVSKALLLRDRKVPPVKSHPFTLYSVRNYKIWLFEVVKLASEYCLGRSSHSSLSILVGECFKEAIFVAIVVNRLITPVCSIV